MSESQSSRVVSILILILILSFRASMYLYQQLGARPSLFLDLTLPLYNPRPTLSELPPAIITSSSFLQVPAFTPPRARYISTLPTCKQEVASNGPFSSGNCSARQSSPMSDRTYWKPLIALAPLLPQAKSRTRYARFFSLLPTLVTADFFTSPGQHIFNKAGPFSQTPPIGPRAAANTCPQYLFPRQTCLISDTQEMASALASPSSSSPSDIFQSVITPRFPNTCLFNETPVHICSRRDVPALVFSTTAAPVVPLRKSKPMLMAQDFKLLPTCSLLLLIPLCIALLSLTSAPLFSFQLSAAAFSALIEHLDLHVELTIALYIGRFIRDGVVRSTAATFPSAIAFGRRLATAIHLFSALWHTLMTGVIRTRDRLSGKLEQERVSIFLGPAFLIGLTFAPSIAAGRRDPSLRRYRSCPFRGNAGLGTSRLFAKAKSQVDDGY